MVFGYSSERINEQNLELQIDYLFSKLEVYI